MLKAVIGLPSFRAVPTATPLMGDAVSFLNLPLNVFPEQLEIIQPPKSVAPAEDESSESAAPMATTTRMRRPTGGPSHAAGGLRNEKGRPGGRPEACAGEDLNLHGLCGH